MTEDTWECYCQPLRRQAVSEKEYRETIQEKHEWENLYWKQVEHFNTVREIFENAEWFRNRIQRLVNAGVIKKDEYQARIDSFDTLLAGFDLKFNKNYLSSNASSKGEE